MKTVVKSSLYYSAYPLKVLEKVAASADTEPSPQLKALLTNKTKTVGRFRISPMADPYRKKPESSTPRPVHSKIVDPDGKEWFNHYE